MVEAVGRERATEWVCLDFYMGVFLSAVNKFLDSYSSSYIVYKKGLAVRISDQHGGHSNLDTIALAWPPSLYSSRKIQLHQACARA